MPMSESFKERLFSRLPEIIGYFGIPFHLYYGPGIMGSGRILNEVFSSLDYRQYFAVKALPNPEILKIMKMLGFGFDCSSIPELSLVRRDDIDADWEDVIFSSNNTTPHEYKTAMSGRGCMLNLDDITMVPIAKRVLGYFPELIFFRYNPGPRRTGNVIIGNPVEAKYGVTHDQIIDAYRLALNEGAKKFGIHTMICSNELNCEYFVETIRMLLGVMGNIGKVLDITFDYMNIGGGVGIPCRPKEEVFDIQGLAQEAAILLGNFESDYGYKPKLLTEMGRYITGPYGVLVTKVTNRMSKYREYVGVNACMSALMRPGIYGPGCYHHITVLDKDGNPKGNAETEVVDVVGSLCENNDKFAVQRSLPKTERGDVLIFHDTGAHGHAMGFNYNGRLRPQELLWDIDDTIRIIRRAETEGDYFATLVDKDPEYTRMMMKISDEGR